MAPKLLWLCAQELEYPATGGSRSSESSPRSYSKGSNDDDLHFESVDIGGMTLAAGTYQWTTGLLIPTDVTLAGSETDIWIFQIAQDLNMSSATNVILNGGALAQNIFWQVSGVANLGTTAHFEGNILGQTAVTLDTGATINGRLLAQTAVNLDSNIVVIP